jgi:DtxR family transcriptional regulator, Mn-dependent transcriptional regulator
MAHFVHHSEENYLKTLYKLHQRQVKKLNNITLAKSLDLNPATVLEMVRKLVQKNLVELTPDKTIHLTEKGKKKALLTIRRHRLWEVFLVEKLNYKWNEVHDLAEQLEHVDSASLIDRIEIFLGHPKFDPHGDPIPDKNGKIKASDAMPFVNALEGKNYAVMSFAETNDAFLDYLSELKIKPGTRLRIKSRNSYDGSLVISSGSRMLQLTEKVAANILVKLT